MCFSKLFMLSENIDEARSGKGIVKRSRSLTKNNLLTSFRPLDCGLLE